MKTTQNVSHLGFRNNVDVPMKRGKYIKRKIYLLKKKKMCIKQKLLLILFGRHSNSSWFYFLWYFGFVFFLFFTGRMFLLKHLMDMGVTKNSVYNFFFSLSVFRWPFYLIFCVLCCVAIATVANIRCYCMLCCAFYVGQCSL